MAQITDDIEEFFDVGQVTGAVFLDLTAACDTVGLTGLHLKLQKAISCKKTKQKAISENKTKQKLQKAIS